MNCRIRSVLILLGMLIAGLSFYPVYGQATTASKEIQEQDEGDDHWTRSGRLEITVTNLTKGQQFTPIFVATHKKGVKLFEAGQPAGSQLAALAEEGDTGPLSALFNGNPNVGSVVTGSGLTNPGQSTTVVVERRGGFSRLSIAAMLIPTNDGFFSVTDIPSPRGREEVVFFAPAYDAGSEKNDELCSSIPGPSFNECGGAGGGGKIAQGEGFVHVHAGIHGIGSFKPSTRDWRNPVAKIVIQRMNDPR